MRNPRTLLTVARLAIVTIGLGALAVGGCDVASVVPFAPAITDEMATQLEGGGLGLRPAAVRDGVLSPDKAMAIAREQVDRPPSTPVYIEVFCIDRRTLGCTSWAGFAGDPGETAGVWVVTFPGEAAQFGPAWAGVDASTGEIVVGDWDLLSDD